jgi:hypothetical protein
MGPPLRVGFKQTAQIQFLGLETGAQREIQDALDAIARSPESPPFWLDVIPVRGQRNGWRLVIRDLRVAYSMLRKRILVTDIQPGHELYRSWGGAGRGTSRTRSSRTVPRKGGVGAAGPGAERVQRSSGLLRNSNSLRPAERRPK